jgi:hypothetical protein
MGAKYHGAIVTLVDRKSLLSSTRLHKILDTLKITDVTHVRAN